MCEAGGLAARPKGGTAVDEGTGSKQMWERPTLIYVGRLGEVVAGGGGKLSPAGGDPGEPRKQQPTG